MLMVIELAKWV